MMTEEDEANVREHVRDILAFGQKPLTLREKRLLAVLALTVEALEHLDDLLTLVPPDLFIYPVDQFKRWQSAREVAQTAREFHEDITGDALPPREER